MQPFEQFIIQGWTIKDSETVQFHYAFDNKETFLEEITFPGANLNVIECDVYLDSLTVALGISYYKLYPTKNILVEHMALDDDQQKFWNEFYSKGLGEFFYVNKMDPTGLAQFSGSGKVTDPDDVSLGVKNLLLRGGGKDSTVSYELLKEAGEEVSLLTVGRQYPIHLATSAVTGEKHLFAPRTLDIAQLKNLTEQGYYHGHVPVTGIISFISALACKLYGFVCIVTSNEKSADFGNVERYGTIINHQRSKSEAFEKLFSDYVKTYIHPGLGYYSRLGNLHEREITKEFAKHKKYFSVFSSCNRNFHQDGRIPGSRRCCICPKCLFVYIILRPFITEEDVITIRGKELYADSGLLSLAQELWGLEGIKPLECVGTPEESQKMTALFIEKNKELATTMPITQRFMNNL